MIVEDEPHAVLLLKDHIGKIPFLELTGNCYDAMSAIDFLKNHSVDVILLDINLPRISGIEMAAMLPKEQKLIFTTAYSEYALDSFDYHVIDYLLKPISFKRFMQAVNKLPLFMQHETSATIAADKNGADDFLFVKSGKQMHRIEYTAILYLEAVKEYIAIHTVKEKILAYKRMKDVAAILPEQFVRIHNSYIVNIKHIRNIESNMVLVKGESLPVSNSYRNIFQEKINAKLL